MTETSPTVYDTLGGVMTVTTMLSFIFNACGLLIFAKNKKLLTPTNMFIVALCTCDLCMCVPATITIIACFNHAGGYNFPLCVFEGFISYLFGLTSIYLLAAISIDRYIIITKPILSTKISKRTTCLCILICFLLALALTVAPLAGWNTYTFEGIGVSCSITWQTGDANSLSYVIFIFVMCFILPMTAMVYCYICIYCTIHKVDRSNLGDSSRRYEKNMAVERKIIFTCIVLVSIFVISWTPYAVVSFMSAFGFSHLITPIVATIPAVIAKTSGIWNPVVYLATNKNFRHSFYKIIPCNSVAECLRNFEDGNESKVVVHVTNVNTLRVTTRRYPGSQISPTPEK